MIFDNTNGIISGTMNDVEYVSWEVVKAEMMEDPAFMAEYDKTFLAGAISLALVSYRGEHGLSQTALGKILGMTQPQVCRLEAGDHSPDFATVQRICEALDLEVSLTIGPTQPERRTVPTARRRDIVTDASRQATAVIRPARRR